MIAQINSLIQKLGIDTSGVSESTTIGERGIGFDSQEIVEFTCMVEKHFKINLPKQFLIKDRSVGEIILFIKNAKKNSCFKALDAFEGYCEADTYINCKLEDAYQAIYQMEKWPEYLPHVDYIKTLYNDGIYQEFLMDVHSNSGLIKVRSIRRCLKDNMITFFQPTPPIFLKHHCGGWKFEEMGVGCNVTTWHQWNRDVMKAEEIFPCQEGLSTMQRVEKVLLDHAKQALFTWKDILEAKS